MRSVSIRPSLRPQIAIARQFMGVPDGALVYWRRVEADMDAAEVELKMIEGGK
jgi:hypothetical protein